MKPELEYAVYLPADGRVAGGARTFAAAMDLLQKHGGGSYLVTRPVDPALSLLEAVTAWRDEFNALYFKPNALLADPITCLTLRRQIRAQAQASGEKATDSTLLGLTLERVEANRAGPRLDLALVDYTDP